jgi:hypothetical protein
MGSWTPTAVEVGSGAGWGLIFLPRLLGSLFLGIDSIA